MAENKQKIRSIAADVIIVLGARSSRTTPSATLHRRIRAGIIAFHRYSASTLLFCGGDSGAGVTEAALMAALAREAGVPEHSLVLENRSHSTWENAQFAAPIIAAAGWKSACIVSDGFHLPRAWLVFRRTALSEIRLCSATAGQPMASPRVYLHEAAGIAWYLLRMAAARCQALFR